MLNNFLKNLKGYIETLVTDIIINNNCNCPPGKKGDIGPKGEKGENVILNFLIFL